MAAAIRGSLAFNLGGMLGSLLSATLLARFGSRYVSRVIAAGSILSTFAIGQQAVFAGGGNVGRSLYAAVALSGMCVNGMQILFYIVATHAYPTALRSAGVGSCGAVGRARRHAAVRPGRRVRAARSRAGRRRRPTTAGRRPAAGGQRRTRSSGGRLRGLYSPCPGKRASTGPSHRRMTRSVNSHSPCRFATLSS